ncbi:hypothetical protein IKF40_01265 [Candidatus Saccharibacteria bacterium]|nr:hypothetical protein [Candidatus Saccharibacteria bacterium]MBR2989547.1 hypothetical protein [Candidatus Saccharibacteria bacterium]
MSETLNNVGEQAGNGGANDVWDTVKEVPFAGDKYKAEHPEAVENVDKAYMMAKAEDADMAEAATVRKGMKDMLAHKAYTPDAEYAREVIGTTGKAEDGVEYIKQRQQAAAEKSKRTGELYDALEATRV